MYHLDLFSGIGGFALACDWAGIETIGFVEIDKYCQKVLRKHWPNVPIVEDIRDVEKIKSILANSRWWEQGECRHAEQMPTHRNSEERPTGETSRPSGEPYTTAIKEVAANASGLQPKQSERTRTESGKAKGRWASSQFTGCSQLSSNDGGNSEHDSPALLVTAGFPCQPFSVAGKRGGEGDDRYLWPETLAVIEAVKPAWVLLENVAGIIPMALDTVLSDLERAGYAWETVVIPACAVNAPHRRDRIWIVAYSRIPEPRGVPGKQRQEGTEIGGSSQDVADPTDREPRRGSAQCHVGGLENEVLRSRWNPDYWSVEPRLGRVAHGIPNRVDRLKCLGNAIVPQVAYEIIRVIKEIEQA